MMLTTNAKRVLLVIALLVAVARADNDDNYKAFGMPWLFTVCIGIGVAITRQPLMNVVAMMKTDKTVIITLVSSFTGMFASFFLLHTAAWDYGLVSLVMFYTALLSANNKSGAGRAMGGVMLIWFFILVGMPDNVSKGLMTVVSQTSCNAFYGTAKDKMCKAGWLTFALINSAFIICMNFVSVALLVAREISGEKPDSASEPWVEHNKDPS